VYRVVVSGIDAASGPIATQVYRSRSAMGLVMRGRASLQASL
jgi:hypothetical protein